MVAPHTLLLMVAGTIAHSLAAVLDEGHNSMRAKTTF